MHDAVMNQPNGWVRFAAGLIAAMFAMTLPAFGRASDGQSKFAQVTVLTENGGHLDWHPKEDLVVFDRMDSKGYFRPWLMRSDGSQQRPLSITVPGFPTKHAGQPAWHPSGNYLALQVQQQNSPNWIDTKAVPGAGVLNDLWIVSADGSRGWKAVALPSKINRHSAALLHPHFSPDGRRLIWSERISGNAKPFGEWVIKLADVHFTGDGQPVLSNIRTFSPGKEKSFYETHNFHPDGRHLLFTGQQDVGLEIYALDIDTANTTRLTRDPAAWDEHAHFSPDGNKIVWMSSRGLRFTAEPFDLQTEFWLMDADGSNARRLTFFHDPTSAHALRSDFAAAADIAWSPDGKSLVGLVITSRPESRERGKGLIVRIDLD
jgi:Tol biopolymer transport system component